MEERGGWKTRRGRERWMKDEKRKREVDERRGEVVNGNGGEQLAHVAFLWGGKKL